MYIFNVIFYLADTKENIPQSMKITCNRKNTMISMVSPKKTPQMTGRPSGCTSFKRCWEKKSNPWKMDFKPMMMMNKLYMSSIKQPTTAKHKINYAVPIKNITTQKHNSYNENDPQVAN